MAQPNIRSTPSANDSLSGELDDRVARRTAIIGNPNGIKSLAKPDELIARWIARAMAIIAV